VDKDGNFIALHRTYITEGGTKQTFDNPKRFLGSTKGGYVVIKPAADTVAIAEGIETAIAVELATGLPVYATLSTSGLESVDLSDEIRTVYIYADKDRSGAGQASAEKAEKRLLAEGRKVIVVYPTMDIPQGVSGVDFLIQYTDGDEGVQE